ncbi:hypothetical protein KDL29_03395 [bacterium]|nr:hypothetical protein [bacterium]
MLYVYPAPEAVISGADKGFWEDEIANLSGAGSLGAITSYEWDLDASWVNGSDDNVFETDYVGQQISFECRFDEQFSLTLRVTDRFGKVDELSSVIDSWRKPSLSCGIDDPYWEQGEVVYQGQEVDLYIGIGGPTELFGNWTVEFPGSNMTALTGTAQPNTFLVPVSWMISGEFLVRVSVDQEVSEVPPSGLVKEFSVNVAAFEPRFTADSFFKPLDSTINFDNSGSVSDLPVSSYSWDYESDGIIDDTGLAPQVSRTFAPGKYLVTMYMHADNGYVRSVSHEAGVLGGALRIIRNDGGLYDANYDAITADLDSLGYGWSSVDYYPGIAADEALTGIPVYIWYRGGPGSALEAAPYTTVWSTSEIDDYIAMMDAGKPLLLMSQSHGKDNDLDLRDPPLDPDGPDGWNIFYGMDKLANSVPKAEVRHVNAAGFSTDDEIGFGGSLSLPMCPQNLSLAGSIIMDSGYSQNNGIFYKGLGSNSRRAYKIQIAECYQLCGTGMYDPGWSWSNYASPKFEHGMATPFYLGYQLGFMSYGNKAAPDANIGFWPSYTHVYGPARLWVVGYPWSQMSVTQAFDQNSQQVPMSRDAALQNILGWLREDEWAAF